MSNGRLQQLKRYAEALPYRGFCPYEYAILCLNTDTAPAGVQKFIIETTDTSLLDRRAFWACVDDARQLLQDIRNRFTWDLIELYP